MSINSYILMFHETHPWYTRKAILQWFSLVILLLMQIVAELPHLSWWRHQMEIFSALLAICVGNSLVIGEFPAQRPVRQSFDVFFDLRLNKWLSKQSWGWWFETPSCPLWRHITRETSWGPDCRNWLFSSVSVDIWTPPFTVLIKISADNSPLN